MIINSSYFQNKSVFIPNSIVNPSLGGNSPDAITQLDMEIAEKEHELLIAFLGQEQTIELLNQFETDGAWKPSALQKWKELVDGVTYDNKKWNGLRYTIGGKKISLIAYYVFFHYLKDDFSTYTTTGINVARSENSVTQDPNGKQVNAWNKFISMYGCNDRYGTDYSFFSNWNGFGIRWGANRNNNEITLYRFMQDNADDYDSSFFTHFNVINVYNL